MVLLLLLLLLLDHTCMAVLAIERFATRLKRPVTFKYYKAITGPDNRLFQGSKQAKSQPP
jgi:hypothetical protein